MPQQHCYLKITEVSHTDQTLRKEGKKQNKEHIHTQEKTKLETVLLVNYLLMLFNEHQI